MSLLPGSPDTGSPLEAPSAPPAPPSPVGHLWKRKRAIRKSNLLVFGHRLSQIKSNALSVNRSNTNKSSHLVTKFYIYISPLLKRNKDFSLSFAVRVLLFMDSCCYQWLYIRGRILFLWYIERPGYFCSLLISCQLFLFLFSFSLLFIMRNIYLHTIHCT